MYIFIHRKLLKDEQLLTMISSGSAMKSGLGHRKKEKYTFGFCPFIAFSAG